MLLSMLCQDKTRFCKAQETSEKPVEGRAQSQQAPHSDLVSPSLRSVHHLSQS